MITKTINDYSAPECEVLWMQESELLCNSFTTEGLTDEDTPYTW